MLGLEFHHLQVERTKLRPVASGQLTQPQGISFLGLQLFLGLGILLQLNNYRLDLFSFPLKLGDTLNSLMYT